MGKDAITRKNLKSFLAVLIKKEKLNIRQVAKEIGCSEATLSRVLTDATWPSDEFIKQCSILVSIGFDKYTQLSKADKENITERLGTISGAGLGFAGIGAAISASGTVAGLSAAGITTGLSAIGGTIIGGVTIVAAFPIVAAMVGFGIIKGIKKIIQNKKLNSDSFDSNWEIPKEEIDE